MKVFLVFLSLALTQNLVFAAENPQTNRVPQFESDEVEVWKTTIYPKQPLKMHRHDHKRILVALTDVLLTVKNDQGKVHVIDLKKGTSRMLEPDKPGELHGDINESDHPMEVMVIQFKDDLVNKKDCH